MQRILLLSKYGEKGASSRVRSIQYVDFLESQNFVITKAELFSNSYLEALYKTGKSKKLLIVFSYVRRLYILLSGIVNKKYDLFWIEKELFPWIPFFFESIFYRLSIKIFVDYDDPVFHIYDKHSSLIVRRMLGGKIPKIMKYSSFVSVSSHYMKDFVINSGVDQNKVKVIPPGIKYSDFRKKIESKKQSKCTIGWIGSPSATPYLFVIEDALRLIKRRYDVEFLLIGAGKNIPKRIGFKRIKWSRENEITQLTKFDIGIMPLSDDYSSIARDSHKIVKYMSASIPYVSSAVKESLLDTQHGVNGFIAQDVSEWEAYLSLLIENENLRREMGKNGYKTAMKKNCTRKVQKDIQQILDRLISKH